MRPRAEGDGKAGRAEAADGLPTPHDPGPGIDAKVRYLKSRARLAAPASGEAWIETHMSWIFFDGDRVLKLKKPVRYPFLDFSTLSKREFDCREEIRLNERLAPGVYIGLVALQWNGGSFSLADEAELPATGWTVDWLVSMRRLPEDRTLRATIARGGPDTSELDRLAAALGGFYGKAAPVRLAPDEYVSRFERGQSANREVLLRPQFQLRDAARALDMFDTALALNREMIARRAADGRIVDGHGDLRPEHVYLLEPPVVIDCIEFNVHLRQVDPIDELAFLALECELAGAAWVGAWLIERCCAALADLPPRGLVDLYAAFRGLIRARLAMAHLLDPRPANPAKWPGLARRYIECSLSALARLDARPQPLIAATLGDKP